MRIKSLLVSFLTLVFLSSCGSQTSNYTLNQPFLAGNGLYGYKDGKDVVRIEAKYEQARNFREDVAAVRLNQKWGIIDKKGKILINFIYEDAQEFKEGLIPVKKDAKWSFINQSGTSITPFQYESVEPFRDGISRVSIKRSDVTIPLFGLINKNGEQVLPCNFISIGDFEGGKALVTEYTSNYVMDYGRALIAPLLGQKDPASYEINKQGQKIDQ